MNKNQDSTNMTRLSRKFLNEMTSIEKDDTLDTLINMLESANDPDPSELYLLESLYQLKEKIKLSQSRINSYLKKNLPIQSGNKLSDLYDTKRSIGSSILFND